MQQHNEQSTISRLHQLLFFHVTLDQINLKVILNFLQTVQLPDHIEKVLVFYPILFYPFSLSMIAFAIRSGTSIGGQ